MKLTSEEIQKLPNLLEVVNKVMAEERIALEKHSPPILLWEPCPSVIHVPQVEYYNTYDLNKFITVRLTSRDRERPEKFVFKPNLKERMFLFRGQSGFFDPCVPSLLRKREGRFVVENIFYEEFLLALHDHPLIRMFKDGVNLGGHRYFFEVTQYGLAQHYGLITSVMDLTSDVEVAKFFAVTDYDPTSDTFSPILDDSRFGVFYYWDSVRDSRAFQFSLLGTNLSNIGLQVFPRSGRQKGFLYSMLRGENFHDVPFVKYCLFRHEADISKQIFKDARKGKKYFPEDELSTLVRRIRNSSVLSGEAFLNNLKNNPSDDKNKNYNDCLSANIKINFQLPHITFNALEKDMFRKRLKDGFWQKFCGQIIFPKDKDGKLMQEFLNLPNHPSYKHYFEWK